MIEPETIDKIMIDSDTIYEFTRAIEQLARNSALEDAAKLVDDRFDECEPWICGDAIRALKENK